MFAALLFLLVVLSSSSTCPTGSGCINEGVRKHLTDVLKSKTITVVTVNDEYPFVARVGNGVPFGLDIDLLNYIGYIYRIDFQYQYAAFQDLIPTVQGDPSIISISSQTITEARIKLVDFAQFFKTGSAFIVRSLYSETIVGLASLCVKTVAVISSTIQAQDVQQQSAKCGAQPITIISVTGYADLINLVANGTADVGVEDEALLVTSALDSNGQLKVVGTPYNVQPYGIVCNKESRALCCALVDAINHLIREGVYGHLLERYSFSYKNNGVCPSRINLNGPTCESKCLPPRFKCNKYLN